MAGYVFANPTRTWPADSGPLRGPRVCLARLDGPREGRADQDSSRCTGLISSRQCRAKDCALFGRRKDLWRLRLDFGRGGGRRLGMDRGRHQRKHRCPRMIRRVSTGYAMVAATESIQEHPAGQSETRQNRLARRGGASRVYTGPNGIGEVLLVDQSTTDNTN